MAFGEDGELVLSRALHGGRWRTRYHPLLQYVGRFAESRLLEIAGE